MAVTQISRIQHRRGLQEDLPQLASAELGWSVDQRRLFIGNGTLEEGAPTVGITEILTEYSELSSLLTAYDFKGLSAGYTAQTGTSLLSPTVRSYQQKLDDFVNVKDFGATGDGTTDDSTAINRAFTQIYKIGYNETQPSSQRSIYFPGGTYVTSNTVLIPPNARLVGDGINSSIIQINQGNRSVANVTDSLFQTGSSIGTSSASLPNNIEIYGITFKQSNVAPSMPVLIIDSAANINIHAAGFIGNLSAGNYANLVHIIGTSIPSNNITFDKCKFLAGGNAISILNPSVSSVRITNSIFDNLANVGINTGSASSIVSIGNYYGNVSSAATRYNSDYYSFGDYFYYDNVNLPGIYLGNLQISQTKKFNVTSTPSTLSLLSNTSVTINYEISNSSARRFGQFRYLSNGVTTLFDDDYIETSLGIGANLFANTDSLTFSVNSGSATLQLNFSRFL
jgi:hypothetical protein